MYNPYLPNNGLGIQYPNQVPPMAAGQEIIRVHGEDGARAYVLGPNSSVLLMDETDNIIWAKMTDGAGYATLRGFRISPMEEKASTVADGYATKDEFNDLKKRFDDLMEELNGKSDS